MYNSRPIMTLRNVARSLGITRVVAKFTNSGKYEERFGNAMLGAVHPGDVVWDIGANVGYYTKQFAEAVGTQGKVVAFEPVPAAFRKLSEAVAGHNNVRTVNAALGAKSGTVTFSLGTQDADPTSKIVEGGVAIAGKAIDLPMLTGDEAMTREQLPQPTFVKIDVEGFEPDVVEGLTNVLQSKACKNVFIEVHFGLLQARGKSASVETILSRMKQFGYTPRWIDASHIQATRV